jgi:hypothetical protein
MGQSSKKNPFEGKDCFNCGEIGHISINCPNKKEDKYGKKKDKKSVPKRKKYYKKEKNGQAYFVEWDSDASSDEDDDEKPSRGLARVAIKEAPSLFSKPYCLMAKGETKVIIDDDVDDDCDSDNNDNALSYDNLVAKVIKSNDKLRMERSKLRDLELKNISLKNSFEKLKTIHENLKTSHETLNISWETLKEKHEERKEAHNSLLAQEVKGKMSMGVECNILNTSPCSSTPPCSTSTISCISEDISCDSLVLENESLKKEIECLSNDLARYFGSHVRFNHIWTNQKFTLEKNGLGYLPKKGKEAFIPKEKVFVTSNVTYEEEEEVKMCHKCKEKSSCESPMQEQEDRILGSFLYS